MEHPFSNAIRRKRPKQNARKSAATQACAGTRTAAGVLFANARGESLIERFPVLGQIGEPIFLATALFMVATVIALAISWSMTRTLPMMPLISGIVVLVFGALTLWLHNDTFIKMKPTIVNTLFGAILLGGLLFGKSCLVMCLIRLSSWMQRVGAS